MEVFLFIFFTGFIGALCAFTRLKGLSRFQSFFIGTCFSYFSILITVLILSLIYPEAKEPDKPGIFYAIFIILPLIIGIFFSLNADPQKQSGSETKQ